MKQNVYMSIILIVKITQFIIKYISTLYLFDFLKRIHLKEMKYNKILIFSYFNNSIIMSHTSSKV